MELARTALDALKLTLMVLPPRPARRIGPRAFWLSALLATVLLALESYANAQPPRAFTLTGFQGVAFVTLLALLVAYLCAIALKRPALLWPLATLLILTQVFIDLVILTPLELWVLPATGMSHEARYRAIVGVWCVMSVLATKRVFDHLEPYRAAGTRAVTAGAVAAAVLAPVWFVGTGMFFYTAFDASEPDTMTIEANPIAFDPERLMMRQDELVDSAIAALEPQRAGVVDLYLVGFGGDAAENVFRNEVEYVDRLFASRFGARGRTLKLVNHADTVDQYPLATRANLDRALAGLGRVADREEDIVMVFLTSHGSEDHELLVTLDPLPLAQLTPADLAAAIDEAALGWRVVVVSACYAGGFIPALADERALVIAAARADRTSFGCGTESEITWFGRALFAQALNETDSIVDAFERADAFVAEWESRDDKPRSHPQLSTSGAIEAKLDAWRRGLELGAPVPFDAAP